MIPAELIESASGVVTVFDADISLSITPLARWTLVARAGGGTAPAIRRLIAEVGPPARRLIVPSGLLTWRGVVENWQPLPCPGPIVGCGGGAVLDAAKLFRLFDARGPESREVSEGITGPPLFCIPTTCGSGSEQTQTVSIWDGGRKQSLDGPALRPNRALYARGYVGPEWDAVAIGAYWDALSHSLESLWSSRAKPLSTRLARYALSALAGALEEDIDWAALQRGAAMSGAAIALTRTGIAHALSYPLTTATNCPHGLAAGLWAVALSGYMAARDAQLARLLEEALGGFAESRLAKLWRDSGASELASGYIGIPHLVATEGEDLDPERSRASRFVPDNAELSDLSRQAMALLRPFA